MKVEGATNGRPGVTVHKAEMNLEIESSRQQVKSSKGSVQNDNGFQTGKNLIKKHEKQPHSISISEKAVIEAIERANKALEGVYTSFEFSIHDETHEIMVKVLNRETKEVIREIPPEKLLDMVAKMWEMAGILVDEKR